MLRNNSKVAVVTEVSVKYNCLSIICDLKCFAFVLLCLIFSGAAAGVGQIDSTNSVVAQMDNASDQSLNNSINLSSSMSQTKGTGNQTSSPKLPILTENSDKGAYKVELRWSSPADIQSPAILSQDGFDLELLFLNASAQEVTPQTVQGNFSTMDFGRSISVEVSNLSTVEPIVPIDSFDIAIYDDKGKEMWSKMDQTLTAGRSPLRIMLDPNYSGGITIAVTDIKSPVTSGSSEKTGESVRFTAAVQGKQS